jgi:hypothetical protein
MIRQVHGRKEEAGGREDEGEVMVVTQVTRVTPALVTSPGKALPTQENVVRAVVGRELRDPENSLKTRLQRNRDLYSQLLIMVN